jgi:general secretion pathway protein G
MRIEREKGLSLIEVIIILAVLVILVALLVPSTVQILSGARRNVTLDEMENLKKAMIGDPDLKTSGVRSSFGYLGDMGNLPSTLDDLMTQGAQPAYAFNSSKGVGAGWRGPYITLGPGSDAASHRVDAFGNDYTYSGTNYVNGQGQTVDAKVVSLGADGVAGGTGNDEDVTLETLVAETTATVTGYGFDASGNPLDTTSVTINYPANGTLTSSTTTTDSAGFYQFTSIPFGIRSVSFNPRLVYVPGSLRISGTGNRDVEFRVANYSTSDITVRTLQATWSAPTSFYNIVRWAGTAVFNCASTPPAIGSGTTTPNFTANQTVAADPTPPPRTQVVVDASNVQVPDVVIKGSGTEAIVRLENNRTVSTCGGGSNVNMTTVTYSNITLRDPSNNIVGSFSIP